MSLHPPWEQLSSATTHLGHGLFQGSLQRELGKQGQAKDQQGEGKLYSWLYSCFSNCWPSHIYEHPGSSKGHSSAQRLQAEVNYVPGAYKSVFVGFQDALQSDHASWLPPHPQTERSEATFCNKRPKILMYSYGFRSCDSQKTSHWMITGHK